MEKFYKIIKSPVGNLKLIANEDTLLGILWENNNNIKIRLENLIEQSTNEVLLKTEYELNQYFLGNLKSFSVKCDFFGTEFQKSVWSTLLTIPFGTTTTYITIASQIGKPKAIRAVGTAIGKNPIPIIIPCHRVIASNGSLAGFSGGIDIKHYLLNLEKTI